MRKNVFNNELSTHEVYVITRVRKNIHLRCVKFIFPCEGQILCINVFGLIEEIMCLWFLSVELRALVPYV